MCSGLCSRVLAVTLTDCLSWEKRKHRDERHELIVCQGLMLVLVWLLGIPRSTARHCHSNPPRSQTTVRFLLRLIRCLTFPKAFYGNERNICRYFCSVWFNLLIMTRLWWVMGGCGLLGAQWPGIIWNEDSGHFPVTGAALSVYPGSHKPLGLVVSSSHSFSPRLCRWPLDSQRQENMRRRRGDLIEQENGEERSFLARMTSAMSAATGK